MPLLLLLFFYLLKCDFKGKKVETLFKNIFFRFYAPYFAFIHLILLLFTLFCFFTFDLISSFVGEFFEFVPFFVSYSSLGWIFTHLPIINLFEKKLPLYSLAFR